MKCFARHASFLLALSLLVPIAGLARTITTTIPPGDTQALINAIGNPAIGQQDVQIIVITGVYTFTPANLPSGGLNIRANTRIQGDGSVKIVYDGAPSPGPLFDVAGNALTLNKVEISGFNTSGSGGVLRQSGGTVTITNTVLSGNRAAQDGGAVTITGGILEIQNTYFLNNRAGNMGGGLNILGNLKDITISNNLFDGNSAGVFGCDLNVFGASDTTALVARNNQFFGAGCQNVRIENPSGALLLMHNTANNGGAEEFIHSTSSSTSLGGMLLDWLGAKSLGKSSKAACQDFGSGALRSLGGNIATEASCRLNQSSDLITASTGLQGRGANGILGVADNGPGIERGSSTLVTSGNRRLLPCGYRDLRGLGRPQDANADGVFACDTGAIEKQGGANLAAPVSGTYFDTTRNGEGFSIENIGNNQAFVAMFSYGVNGGLLWFFGLGDIVGNSVVIDDFQQTAGGVFGPAFNAGNVVRSRVGGASFVFPNCAAETGPGQFAFQAAPGTAFEDLLSKATRLTYVVPCTGAPNVDAGRSGSFFAPTRDGEGIFVQVLPNGRALIIWYTYDPQGRQFWTISSDANVSGNTITASMLYPSQTTRFGSNFNQSQVQLSPWGTVTLVYSGCNALSFSYSSTVAGFGSGQYNYQRLTSLAGTNCQ